MPFSVLLVLIFLVLTWLSVVLLEKRNIIRLWLSPANQRLKEFTFGFILMGTLCLITQLIFSLINDISWTISDEISISTFLYASALDINSVLFEELLFCGVILYGLIPLTNRQIVNKSSNLIIL